MRKILFLLLSIIIPAISYAQANKRVMDEKWINSVSTFLLDLQENEKLHSDILIYKFINTIKLADIKFIDYNYKFVTTLEGEIEDAVEEEESVSGYGYIYERIEEPKKETKEKKEEILDTTYKLSISKFRIEVGYKQNYIKSYIMNKDGSQDAVSSTRTMYDIYSIDKKYKIKYETTQMGKQ